MVFSLIVIASMTILGCKPTNRASQLKNSPKTEKGFALTGQNASKLFNVTKLTGHELQIPIAVSLEVKKKYVSSTVSSTDSAKPQYGDLKIIMHIKDLRHDHSSTPVQKVTLFHEETSGKFHGENKYGSYWFDVGNLQSGGRGKIEFKSETDKTHYTARVTMNKSIEDFYEDGDGRANMGTNFAAERITERMFDIIQGKVRSPTVEGLLSSSCAKKMSKQNDGETSYYGPSKSFADKGFAFKFYGLDSLFAKGILNNKLKCRVSSKHFFATKYFLATDDGYRDILYDNTVIYFSDQLEHFDSDVYFTAISVSLRPHRELGYGFERSYYIYKLGSDVNREPDLQ